MNFPLVNNLVGTIVIPCFLASVKLDNCFLLTNNFRAEVSTERLFASPRTFNRSEKLALFSHNSPFLKLTNEPLSWTCPSLAARKMCIRDRVNCARRCVSCDRAENNAVILQKHED